MPEQKSAGSELSELINLLKRYVLQETVGPLKTMGRTVGFGAAAAFLLGIGGVFLLIGVLRVLQTETGTTFTGHWSWAPYFLTVVAGTLFLGAAAAGVLRSPKRPPSRATSEASSPEGR